MNEIYRTNQVFVAGGFPQLTYNDRSDLGLEAQLEEYLQTGYKILSVTGPTKSGKTVLCNKMIPSDEGVWISGGQVDTEETFWDLINSELNNFSTLETQFEEAYIDGSTANLDGTINAGIAKIGSKVDQKKETQTRTRHASSLKPNPKINAINALLEQDLILIVDDFHYISKEIQTAIVRSLKQPIFKGLKVIIIAVPHRAYDAVKVETEMTGRVQQLNIPLWTQKELLEIPIKGLPLLNVSIEENFINTLSEESFGSPHLMQEFCAKLMSVNEVKSTKSIKIKVNTPSNINSFFQSIVRTSTSKIAFEKLSRGPRPRTDRMKRQFKNGSEGDIYNAMLAALAHSGPKTRLTYEEIRQSMKEILTDSVPQVNEITRVLSKISEIAKDEIVGEPVLEWDKDDSVLYIADPFFAFFLKWNNE